MSFFLKLYWYRRIEKTQPGNKNVFEIQYNAIQCSCLFTHVSSSELSSFTILTCGLRYVYLNLMPH